MLTNYLALDVGTVRIGVATANSIARLAAPLPAIENDQTITERLQSLIHDQQASVVVVGWPRNLQGQATDQTQYVEQFVERLRQSCDATVELQDEALTSVRAEEELRSRGKGYEKGDIDSLSAVYILEDYLEDRLH
jgi:putative holliday junction resolvase